jgi:hypothetical protein
METRFYYNRINKEKIIKKVIELKKYGKRGN